MTSAKRRASSAVRGRSAVRRVSVDIPAALSRPRPPTSQVDGANLGACATVPRPGATPSARRRPRRTPMATPVIVSATRTAIGTLGGALAQVPATKLGSIAVREAIRRARLDPAQVDEVILGHVLPAGLGLNPGRVAALDAGVPKEVPS